MNWNSSVSYFTLASAMAAIGWSGLMVQLVPGRHARVYVQVRGRGAIAAMGPAARLPREIQRPIALQSETLHRVPALNQAFTASRRPEGLAQLGSYEGASG